MTFSQDEAAFWVAYQRIKAKEPEVVTLPFRTYRPFVMGNPYPVKRKEDLVA